MVIVPVIVMVVKQKGYVNPLSAATYSHYCIIITSQIYIIKNTHDEKMKLIKYDAVLQHKLLSTI